MWVMEGSKFQTATLPIEDLTDFFVVISGLVLPAVFEDFPRSVPRTVITLATC